ncbi:MAG: excinuclease ABC subunit UvrA [Clostridia bacterium]|nr:excinuclease ABC subunit UvrA [Clostridia bacterium]
MLNEIIIKGAKENNLKNIDLNLPRNKLIVFTGVSGSGKSTLAFDTIYAEGQRRYVESLSSYARQFLGQMQKPDVDLIEGLSPAISIDQKTTNNNPRSTVGTITEIYDYLRLLFARVGIPHCPRCGREIAKQSVDQIVDKIKQDVPLGEKFMVLAPVIRGQKGEHIKVLDSIRNSGFVRVDIDGNIYTFDEDIILDKNKKHSISIVIDRIIMKEDIDKRLTESVELALKNANGLVVIVTPEKQFVFSNQFACQHCGISFDEITPRLFSFNNPFGACPECHGLGFTSEIDPDLIVKDKNKSIREGAINVTGWGLDSSLFSLSYFEALSNKYHFSLDVPFKELPKEIVDIIMYGNFGEELDLSMNTKRFSGNMRGSFEGIVNNLKRRYHETTSDYIKGEIAKYMRDQPCVVCKGERLREVALGVKIFGENITSLTNKSIDELYEFFEQNEFTPSQKLIADSIVKEIKARLTFLRDVGLNYLTLSRSAGSLSGGESQRIRLATQIGSGLTGVIYILDEPSIGLHQRDNDRLIATLKHLRDLGNTLIVVEHDEDTMREADYIVDIGPRAGAHGGSLVASGTLQDIMDNPNSITGQYLSGAKKVIVPTERRKSNGGAIKVFGARENNLKNIDVEFPLGVLTVVTGVSGSGKSSLITDILYPALSNRLNKSTMAEGRYDKIEGLQDVDKVIAIDQSPIGRTPRSNPATYTGVFTQIRELFASTPDAKERGYLPGRFSFNVSGGRCETCCGDGIKKIEMYFLPDIYVPCEDCKGRRYNRETLEVKYKGKSIYDVLEMTVEEALTFFENQPQIKSKIQTLFDVGLGYIKLGQSATTLSGGEAQRVKLATELAKKSTGKTVYILDEPTTGLHIDDVEKLIKIMNRLVDAGNTVIVIEHNLDVIKVADHILDIGPEGGVGGGQVIAKGTPEDIANSPISHTGRFLAKILNKDK